MLISVDTFYSAVAREAVAAGAHIVNDVSGGDLDPTMHAAVCVASAALSVRTSKLLCMLYLGYALSFLPVLCHDAHVKCGSKTLANSHS